MPYGPAHAELYDLVFRSRGKDFEAEAAEVAKLVRARCPDARTLLDVACGTGAHLAGFARLFERCEGVDLAPAMLRIARDRLPDVPLHHGDMRDFALDGVFDVVVCMGNAVACAGDTAELDAVISRMAGHLAPGGVLVIEPWWFPDNFLDGHVGGHVAQDGDRIISRTTHSRRQDGRTRMEIRFVVADRDGITDFTDVLVNTLFTVQEYQSAFERAGCPAEFLPSLRLTGGRPNSPGLFVARKGKPSVPAPADAGLGRRLQLVQGIVWAHAAAGDPYAAALRGFDEDPAPLFERARARGPLWRSDIGTWVTAGHHLAAEVLDHPLLDSLPAAQPDQAVPLAQAGIDLDRAQATRLSEVCATLLGPSHHADTQRSCARLLDDLGSSASGFDVVTGLADRLPVEVLAGLFALDSGPAAQLGEWCSAAGVAVDGVLCPQTVDATHRMLSAISGLRALFEESASRPDVAACGVLLAVLGVRMAADLTTAAVRALVAQPSLWAAVAGQPSLARGVVAETLRYEPPVRVALRVARADVELAGQPVPAGGQVAVLLAAANRDPAVFPEPERFDPHRTVQAGAILSAGGPHQVVLPFAATQAEVVVAALAARWPRLRMSGPAVRRPRAPVTRGMSHLPVSTG